MVELMKSKKDELIIEILKKELKYIKKLLKEQDKQIKEIRKSGVDSEIHPAYHVDIQTGLSYTSGYCNGYIILAEQIIEMLESSCEDIEKMISENKRISAENKKYLDDIFAEIKKDIN